MDVVVVDQGTTSTKTGLLHGATEFVSVNQRVHSQRYPRDGYVEHDPDELLANVRAGLDAVPSTAVVEAIGLANQGETVVAWDARTGRPICPLIVWQDNRTSDRVEALRREGAEALTLSRAGLPLDPYFSASKLGWILEHVPEARTLLSAGQLRLGTSDAFFLYRLAGQFATDVTTASRTSLLDLRTRRWDPELCSLFGVPIEALPEIRPTMGWFGDVDLGGRSVPITASVVDQQAALYGHGCRTRGEGKVTFGTGAFFLTVAGETCPDVVEDGLLPTIAWQAEGGSATYALEGGVYDAGSALDWAHELGLFDDHAELEALSGAPAVERGLVFVPALSGLACPHWDRSAAATWIGMTRGTSRQDLARAVLEGVALMTAEVIRRADRIAPPNGPLSVDGGLTRSAAFCRFLADVLRRPIRAPSFIELTMLGTAQLAAGGADPLEGAAVVVHEPSGEDPRSWIERFADAVTRTRAWHR
ncbi:MAG: glycerol kinase [Chloroflexi bacterium]|nr:glycerol kinase [Chloroflexota bacterium]